MPNIDGGSHPQQANVQNAIDDALQRLARGEITGDSLRDCIRNRAQGSDTIYLETCDNPILLGYNRYIGFGTVKIKSSDIHLCINNIERLGASISGRLLHEWAHSCCWEHTDPGNVPDHGWR